MSRHAKTEINLFIFLSPLVLLPFHDSLASSPLCISASDLVAGGGRPRRLLRQLLSGEEASADRRAAISHAEPAAAVEKAGGKEGERLCGWKGGGGRVSDSAGLQRRHGGRILIIRRRRKNGRRP